MTFFTYILHLIFSGATAYLSARNIRDPITRRQVLAEYQVGESGSVSYLQSLSERAATENDPWLSERLASHAADEERHGKIFGHALKQLLNHEAKNASQLKINQNQAALTPSTLFYTAYLEGLNHKDLKPETVDWNVFLGSLYILELDASKEFVRMANVLPTNDQLSINLKKSIMSVASDETRHAAYLYEAIKRRVGATRVDMVIDEWRTRQIKASLSIIASVISGAQPPAQLEDGILYSWV
jgi:rubrerythrin